MSPGTTKPKQTQKRESRKKNRRGLLRVRRALRVKNRPVEFADYASVLRGKKNFSGDTKRVGFQPVDLRKDQQIC